MTSVLSPPCDRCGGMLAPNDLVCTRCGGFAHRVELEQARDKDYVIPGDYELYLFGDRRPELYGALVEQSLPITT